MQGSLSCPCSSQSGLVRPGRRGRLQSARVSAILAPAPQRGTGSSEASTSQPGAGVFSWGANAASALRLWPGGQDTQREAQQVQQAIQEASRQQATKAGRERPAPDVGRFLSSCSNHELRHVRLLASLSALTYYMGTLTPRSLERRHGLDLVYTSLACELALYEPSKTAEESLADGDGMAVSLADASSMYTQRNAAAQQRLAGASNIVIFPSKGKGALAAAKPVGPKKQQQQQQQQQGQQSTPGSSLKRPTAAAGTGAAATASIPTTTTTSSSSSGTSSSTTSASWNPADLVAAKLSEAAALASAAALQPLASAAGSLYSSGVGFVSSALSQQLPVDKLAAVALAGVAGAEASSGPSNPSEVKAASTSSCPSEWFVADDGASHTRYFVIQGSDSLDHWKMNFMFDPVVFEDAAMGVMVHRGVYEAANALYERFLPLVQEHADSSPFARVCFTGHSVGGSMATLLALLFKKRGVLSASQLAPCYTFGAPAVFCEGGACCSSCTADASTPSNTTAALNRSQRALDPKSCGNGAEAYHGVQVAGGGGLLQACGLKEDTLRNVIMHRDIVPRAFACDYNLVADMLRSWGPGFKDHRCLARDGRKHMYFFVGQMMVLQPDAELAFTNGEPYHPMLPAAGGLFVLSQPTLGSTMAAMRAAREAGSSSMAVAVSNATSSTTAGSGGKGGSSIAKSSSSASNGSSATVTKEVASVSEVVWELMDNPHPLDILGDPGAYLTNGSISRYHNPDNYKRALGCILAKRRDAAADVLAGPSAVPAAARKQRAFFPVVSAANAGPSKAAATAAPVAAATLQAA